MFFENTYGITWMLISRGLSFDSNNKFTPGDFNF